MHFGLYLKNKGIISAEQLVAALETQLNTLTPIGQLALEEGIISPRDIFDVLRAQSESPDVRFGDLAIEMGLMTRNDLMRLLMIQADRKRPLAEILVRQGVLTERTVRHGDGRVSPIDGETASQRHDAVKDFDARSQLRRQDSGAITAELAGGACCRRGVACCVG